MYSKKLFTAEVGTFLYKTGGFVFNESGLLIPLVNNTVIGRVADEQEQGLCDGGSIREVQGQNIGGSSVYFIERPSYNGRKLIIPSDPHHFSSSISRQHGELRLNEGEIEFYYQQLGNRGYGTVLWREGSGIIGEAKDRGELMNLQFEKDTPEDIRYLLLGSHKGIALEEKFPWPSYYVRVKREIRL